MNVTQAMKVTQALKVTQARSGHLLAIAAALVLGACALPEFPQNGTPSPYDGQWVVDLKAPENPNCRNMRGEFEVRYAYLIGLIEWRSENYDVWGEISPEGKLDGLIGQLGVRGATATAVFDGDKATGTWESKGCGKGTLSAHKKGA